MTFPDATANMDGPSVYKDCMEALDLPEAEREKYRPATEDPMNLPADAKGELQQ
jgi:hypothetical protein